MQVNGNAERTLGGGHSGDVIDVGVGQQQMTHVQLFTLDERQQRRHFVAGIDEDGLARLFARDDKSVLEERPDRLRFYAHVHLCRVAARASSSAEVRRR